MNKYKNINKMIAPSCNTDRHTFWQISTTLKLMLPYMVVYSTLKMKPEAPWSQ